MSDNSDFQPMMTPRKPKRTNKAEVWDLNNGSGNHAVAVDGYMVFVSRNLEAAKIYAADHNRRAFGLDAPTEPELHRALASNR